MRLKIPLFRSRAAWRGEIASTMPRRVTSSAISRAVHWLIGRPDAGGASQARPMMAQTCSAPMRAGGPGRGASAKRSALLRSFRGIPARLARAVPPQPHCFAREAHPRADLHRAHTCTGQQDDLGPQSHLPRRCRGRAPAAPPPRAPRASTPLSSASAPPSVPPLCCWASPLLPLVYHLPPPYFSPPVLGTEPWTLPRDAGFLRAVIRRPLWDGGGASEQADELTSQHRWPRPKG